MLHEPSHPSQDVDEEFYQRSRFDSQDTEVD